MQQRFWSLCFLRLHGLFLLLSFSFSSVSLCIYTHTTQKSIYIYCAAGTATWKLLGQICHALRSACKIVQHTCLTKQLIFLFDQHNIILWHTPSSTWCRCLRTLWHRSALFWLLAILTMMQFLSFILRTTMMCWHHYPWEANHLHTIDFKEDGIQYTSLPVIFNITGHISPDEHCSITRDNKDEDQPITSCWLQPCPDEILSIEWAHMLKWFISIISNTSKKIDLSKLFHHSQKINNIQCKIARLSQYVVSNNSSEWAQL